MSKDKVCGDLNSIRLLHQILEEAAKAWPDRVAVVHGKERKTYACLDKNANRIGSALLNAGIRRGERVGILMPNGVDYICAYFGISKMGGVAVPINTAIHPEGLSYLLQDAGIRALMFHGSVRAVFNRLAYEMERLDIIFSEAKTIEHLEAKNTGTTNLRSLENIYREEDACSPANDTSPEELACLYYTSGSTGLSKGVMLSHLNILENTRSIVQYLGLNRNDRMMVILPFFYCYGASLIHTHFTVGGSLVIENQFLYPNKVLEMMQGEKVTGLAGVPYTFAILLRRSNIRSYTFENLRYVTQAGGAMAPSLVQELREVLPRTKVFIMYGQTEASARLSYLPPELLDKKPGSIGKGIPNVELRVLNGQGSKVKPGEVGEIVARGNNLMMGYWNSPEETRKVMDELGLHTGDLARIDEEGFIFIVGRRKDMIKSGSHRVGAKEIEDMIMKEQSVLDCAVIGIEDELMGEVIKAFVVPVSRHGTRKEDIINFCKKNLPAYKVPRTVEIVKSLPRNEAGKVVKEKLEDRNT